MILQKLINSLNKTNDFIQMINSLSKTIDFIKNVNLFNKTNDLIKMINLLSKTGLGRSGHVRFPTFGSISHISGSKMVL